MAGTLEAAREALDAFNAHDERRIRETFADDVVFEAPDDVHLEGAEAATEYAMAWLRAFPDARITSHNEIVAGDWAVREFTFSGTHDEPLVGKQGEIPATHRHLVGRGVEVLRIAAGRVVEDRLYYDQVQMLTQLGLVPEPAAARA
ncbi:SnoaL-like polyketide cyclase [Gaiella occulta]|uniref:SnoaL-like polyketide cyclase n=1 Tax=Gaiella occulta TaxID=1002870 RepID=A0A7M2YZ50_9ACTN|nr:ester cyclase [Gaiella occulta]RDI74779.1 SnoaL-like polyketide cyclase [Gaiella occulta]